jgi:hypothetical protein
MTSLSSSAKYLLSDDNGIRHFQDAREPSLRPAWHVMLHATPQQRISAT